MKTYNIGYVLLALVISSCSKSDGVAGGEEKQKSVDADYAVVLDIGNEFSTQLLNANGESIDFNPSHSALSNNPKPQLSFSTGSKFLQYFKNGDCSSSVILHDFSTDKSENIIPFEDLNDCMLTANTISLAENKMFIGYELTNSYSEKEYMLRSFDLNSATSVDVTLPKKPVGSTIANNRLFILTLDELVTEENSLSVLNLSNNDLIHELDLGYGARRIFTNKNDEVIIGYDELHTTMNSNDFSVAYTQYEEGTEPNFAQTSAVNMDDRGQLYYPYDSQSISSYPAIAGVYDFSKKLVTSYAFENFLTEEQRNNEFAIETTTSVVYDIENNLILIGYRKMGTSNEGGLIRIKPVPDPAFVDHIDLEGIPYEIIVQ